jgi:nicotinate-nucleotide pyrophosphorylase (carboxylating)
MCERRRCRLGGGGAGLTLSHAREVGATGVDYIAVGELTHSVTAFDIGLDLQTIVA